MTRGCLVQVRWTVARIWRARWIINACKILSHIQAEVIKSRLLCCGDVETGSRISRNVVFADAIDRRPTSLIIPGPDPRGMLGFTRHALLLDVAPQFRPRSHLDSGAWYPRTNLAAMQNDLPAAVEISSKHRTCIHQKQLAGRMLTSDPRARSICDVWLHNPD